MAQRGLENQNSILMAPGCAVAQSRIQKKSDEKSPPREGNVMLFAV